MSRRQHRDWDRYASSDPADRLLWAALAATAGESLHYEVDPSGRIFAVEAGRVVRELPATDLSAGDVVRIELTGDEPLRFFVNGREWHDLQAGDDAAF